MNKDSRCLRDYSVDHIRFILIFLVVLGHMLEISSPFLGSGKIYKFIYSFHMPVFLFLFGYHSRYSLKRIVCRWCIPYAVFQCAYIVFAKMVLKANVRFQFTTPYWLLWYMLVCIFYQILMPVYDKTDRRAQIAIVAVVLILSFCVGYFDSIGYALSLSRFFVFQPWFVLGYYCKKNGFVQWLDCHRRIQRYAVVVPVVAIAALMPFLWKIPNGLLYGSYSYSRCGGTIWMRAAVFAISACMVLFLFVGIKPYMNKKLMLITQIGQNTWPVFLLHGFVVKATPVYFPGLVDSPWSVVALSCGILLLTGNAFCKKLINYVCFSWLETFEWKRVVRIQRQK